MSFQNLFQRLRPAPDGAAAPACRSEVRGHVPKRRQQEEPPHKKRCDHEQTRAVDAATVDLSTRRHVAAGERAGERAGEERRQLSHNLLGGGNNGANRRMEGQKKLNQRGRRVPRGGGRESRVRRPGADAAVRGKQARFMTQEFKEQNALMVDGRLLCRHFLWGRCIKGDGCQLEHVQGHNDLIKELCKFYVQGFCSKGHDCPYMHQSFPCKYFHRKGRCSQGDACRFSHEPLSDVTTKLLEEAIKRDIELRELAQKAEEASPEPSKEPISSVTESSGIALLPIRPSFYSSTSTNVESEGPFCMAEDAVSGAATPAGPPPPPQDPPQPVCYSVEAVLGPQLSRPFSRFSAASGPKDLDRLSNPPNAPPAGDPGRDTVGETVWCSRPPQEQRRSDVHPEPGSERALDLPLDPGELWRPGPKTQRPQPSLQAFPGAAFERSSSERRSVTSRADGAARPSRTGPAESSHPRSPLALGREPEETQQELRCGSEEPFSPMNSAEGSVAPGAGCTRPLRQPFQGLFARPLTELLKPSHRPELSTSSRASQSADGRNNQNSSSFSSLFAAPLGGQTQTVLSKHAPEDQPASQNLSAHPRTGPEGTRGAAEARPDVSAHTASPVLKTLFGSLKPYQQDEEENQQVPSGLLVSDPL
ncbi:zinc finger CCCH domain-containing protein 6-like isoform X2 [Takifugu rubripes]|uniref:zinc finger CCCH domain-containing protein 6-like isoform X2 n=1 Tax=Takifugu rubripes TaxID=31033 RepID=UPI0011453138|nr:zinc finger CCCH domain-containing protein 6-like isoform X2 [Takifugu rubripes]